MIRSDINECTAGTAQCVNSQCQNTAGSYSCRCNSYNHLVDQRTCQGKFSFYSDSRIFFAQTNIEEEETRVRKRITYKCFTALSLLITVVLNSVDEVKWSQIQIAEPQQRNLRFNKTYTNIKALQRKQFTDLMSTERITTVVFFLASLRRRNLGNELSESVRLSMGQLQRDHRLHQLYQSGSHRSLLYHRRWRMPTDTEPLSGELPLQQHLRLIFLHLQQVVWERSRRLHS